MSKLIGSRFDRMDKLVEASGMVAAEKRRTADCLRQLPPLCESFCVSYESRDLDKILRLERGMLAWLSDPTHPSVQARDLAKVLSMQLKNLHERLGLPPVEPAKATRAPSPPPAPKKGPLQLGRVKA